MGRFTRRAYHVGDVVPPAFAPALSKINLFKGRGDEAWERPAPLFRDHHRDRM